MLRLGLITARLDMHSPTDYLSISIDCRDDRIKVRIKPLASHL